MTGPTALDWYSPSSTSGRSVRPVCRPLSDHSVAPWRTRRISEGSGEPGCDTVAHLRGHWHGMARSILWFRRDLRLTDHPALAAASATGEVIPLFVSDPALVASSGSPRLAFLARVLEGLAATL